MCGITGFVKKNACFHDDDHVLSRMMASISHRGPDDEGRYYDQGAYLGHRRLSIIDLAGGHQPLFSEDRSIAVICNGEIYNHHELRELIQQRGHHPATRSDCEVIAHLWEDEGPAMLARLDGMFAIALWDSRSRTLLLARDRMGKKPLFYGNFNSNLVFGSELSTLMCHPAVPKKISHDAMYRFLTLDYVPTPMCIIEGACKVEPGGFVIHDEDGTRTGRYHEIPIPPILYEKGEKCAAEDVWATLVDATGRRLESEVPLGVFLSGGLDSSAVLAAMAKHQAPETISTFTIGFKDPSYDESAAARQVAAHFGTKHHEQILDGSEAPALVRDVATIADEPLSDYSILPTALLSRFARQHVSVALSGDGGDELFHGYETFKADRWARAATAVLPDLVTKNVLPLLSSLIPVSDKNMSLDYKVDRMVRGLKYGRFDRHLAWTGSFDPDTLHSPQSVLAPDVRRDVAMWQQHPYPDSSRILAGSEGLDPMKRLSLLYCRLYMLDGVLVKVDRASMNVALEVRSPFLDTAMVNLAFSLPAAFNLKGGTTKALIRKILADKIPAGIAGLPKKGFGVPVATWLRTDLKPLVDQYLSPERLHSGGLFQPAAVASMIRAHMSGRHNYRKELFSLLVFELWRERWL